MTTGLNIRKKRIAEN